jgi:dipeptidyl aminopeptidase/acylaminoacyl peptidase
MSYAFKFAKPGDVLNSGKLLRQFLGGTPDEVQKNYDSASGFALAKANSPPTLLIHGRQDELVWAKQSERLNDQLEQLGAPHFYIELPWATHGFDYNFNGPGGQITEWAVERFLSRVTSE